MGLEGLRDLIFRERSFPFSTPGIFFVGFYFLLELLFTQKNQQYTRYSLPQFLTPPPKSTMSSPVVTLAKDMMEKKRIKKKIGVVSILKAKVGEMGDITREGRIIRMKKEVMGCVHAVAGNEKFLVQFEDGQKK